MVGDAASTGSSRNAPDSVGLSTVLPTLTWYWTLPAPTATSSSAEIEAADGSPLVLEVDSLCVHGDTPGAVELARALRDGLAAHAVPVAAFA